MNYQKIAVDLLAYVAYSVDVQIVPIIMQKGFQKPIEVVKGDLYHLQVAVILTNIYKYTSKETATKIFQDVFQVAHNRNIMSWLNDDNRYLEYLKGKGFSPEVDFNKLAETLDVLVKNHEYLAEAANNIYGPCLDWTLVIKNTDDYLAEIMKTHGVYSDSYLRKNNELKEAVSQSSGGCVLIVVPVLLFFCIMFFLV